MARYQLLNNNNNHLNLNIPFPRSIMGWTADSLRQTLKTLISQDLSQLVTNRQLSIITIQRLDAFPVANLLH